MMLGIVAELVCRVAETKHDNCIKQMLKELTHLWLPQIRVEMQDFTTYFPQIQYIEAPLKCHQLTWMILMQ